MLRSGSITASMTVRAHSSRATPSIGCAPARRRRAGRGTRIVPTWRLDDALGVQPVEPDDARLRQSTGANRTLRPAIVTSVMPACRARARNRATSSSDGHLDRRLAVAVDAAPRGAGRRPRRRGPRPAACTSPAAAARWGCSRAAGARRPAARSGPRRARRLGAVAAELVRPPRRPAGRRGRSRRRRCGRTARRRAGCRRRGSRGPSSRSPCRRRGRSAGPAWPAARARSR